MEVFINDKELSQEPTMCGSCPFYFSGNSALIYNPRGFCVLFDETHKGIRNIPRRCHKLFKKALSYPDRTRLAIVETKKIKTK
jgi:hypothetical protein